MNGKRKEHDGPNGDIERTIREERSPRWQPAEPDDDARSETDDSHSHKEKEKRRAPWNVT